MPDSVSFGKFTIPTGYESEQQKIALRRKLAQALLERGFNPPGNMISPLQLIGALAQSAAGARLEGKAGEDEASLGKRIREDYTSHLSKFHQAEASGMSDADLIQNFGSDPLLEDDVKAHRDAVATGLKSRAELVQTASGGYKPKGQITPQNNVDATKMVVPTFSPTGEVSGYRQNPIAIGAAAAARNLVPSGPISMPQSMSVSDLTGGGGASAPPASSPNSIDISRLNPEERMILTKEINRRGSLPQSSELPIGNPLTPPPDGVTSTGKQFWIINGQPSETPPR